MVPTHVDAFDRAQQTAHAWLADVAGALDSDDRRFAYRALRAWLHTLRDRLTVESAVGFGAQLPELLRGVYYDGWQPHRVPVKYGPDEFIQRFALEARLPTTEVRPAAAAVATALAKRFSPGHLAETLGQLPASLRILIGGSKHESLAATTDATSREPEPSVEEQLVALQARVDVLAETVRALAVASAPEPGTRVGHRAVGTDGTRRPGRAGRPGPQSAQTT